MSKKAPNDAPRQTRSLMKSRWQVDVGPCADVDLGALDIYHVALEAEPVDAMLMEDVGSMPLPVWVSIFVGSRSIRIPLSDFERIGDTVAAMRQAIGDTRHLCDLHGFYSDDVCPTCRQESLARDATERLGGTVLYSCNPDEHGESEPDDEPYDYHADAFRDVDP